MRRAFIPAIVTAVLILVIHWLSDKQTTQSMDADNDSHYGSYGNIVCLTLAG
jgi:hypothetical protein